MTVFMVTFYNKLHYLTLITSYNELRINNTYTAFINLSSY